MRARRSEPCARRSTRPFASRRSTAVVIEPLVSRTLRPISLTGSGPLWSSASSTAKSVAPIPCPAILLTAYASTACSAFHSTRNTCTPVPPLNDVTSFVIYLDVKILYFETSCQTPRSRFVASCSKSEECEGAVLFCAAKVIKQHVNCDEDRR